MPNMDLLRDRIKESGMSIVSICEKAGIERATLYNRLDGGRGEWKASEIVGITSALKLSRAERDKIFLE